MATHPNPKAIRRGHRATATRLMADVKTEVEKEEGGSRIKLGVYLNKLAEKLAKIRELDFEIIESMENNEEIEAEAATQDEKVLEIEEAIANLHAFLKGDPHEIEDENDGKKVQSFAKLPKLEIKHFSGDALEFPTFQQQFEASIGRSNLADVGKFSYLKGLLRGEALRSIQGLSLTQENYEAAWDLLIHRYGRKNLVVSSLMRQMTALKPCGDNDTKSLRALLDKISSSIRALDALRGAFRNLWGFVSPIGQAKNAPKIKSNAQQETC